MSPRDRLVTVVVGAGPAGLLFAVAARLLGGRRGISWPILVLDKRSTYERTHRLRIDPVPWRALGDAVSDARFDALLAFLDQGRFRPAVNDLERELASLATALGVERATATVGAGGIALADLPGWLRDRGTLAAGDRLAVVGADSVHSAVREAVRGSAPVVERTHQRVVRLRVVGPGLPEHLGVVEQVRLSKLVDSVLDYRRNPNGFGEVDVFLSEREHPRLAELGASPKEPLPLTDERLAALRDIPLFTRIAAHLRRGFGQGPCEVLLYSTFRLEHRTIERVAFEVPDLGWVFLVGDAAISLPFFRGMACLASCAGALAQVHVELALGGGDEVARRYDAEVARIRGAELAVVASRARAVVLAREVARISAMLPFPLQSWWLSLPEPDDAGGGPTAGFVVNLAVAAAAFVIAVAAPVLDAWVWEPLGWLWLLAVPLQVLGGVVYYAARVLEPGPDRWVRRVWRLQIAAMMVAGVGVVVANSMHLGRPAQLHALVSWWVLGLVFVVGLYAFERWQRRRWSSAELDAL